MREKRMGRTFLKFAFTVACTAMLSACGNDGIDGTWKLSQEKQNQCPIYYKFETVTKKVEKKDVIYHLVEMHTNDKKEDKYKGTYKQENKGDSYILDYGNSFISTQQLKRDGDNLEVIFSDVNKQCTYKKSA
ncbi:hypothetical protein M3215_00300 [Bacillus cytotoxicus]|uniref:Uncharacterized protein n=1 Tax=Bacillus cytotoxicus TaxID=580165 RepID=A0ACC6A1H6_9BACI|nr:hypothetical protein [Bacillus cytotoxicus]